MVRNKVNEAMLLILCVLIVGGWGRTVWRVANEEFELINFIGALFFPLGAILGYM